MGNLGLRVSQTLVLLGSSDILTCSILTITKTNAIICYITSITDVIEA